MLIICWLTPCFLALPLLREMLVPQVTPELRVPQDCRECPVSVVPLVSLD